MLSVYRLSCLRDGQVLFSALDFTIVPTEILHITGPNGCGKSSLLHILMYRLLPCEGEVYWEGIPIAKLGSEYRAELSYVGHKTGVRNRLTVLENLQLAAKLSRKALTKVDWWVLLHRMGLENINHVLCQHLSVGQRQRVALTRLLLSQARLWILDEPFTALDAETASLLQTLLLEHCAQGGMVVLTSHHTLQWGDKKIRQLALGRSA